MRAIIRLNRLSTRTISVSSLTSAYCSSNPYSKIPLSLLPVLNLNSVFPFVLIRSKRKTNTLICLIMRQTIINLKSKIKSLFVPRKKETIHQFLGEMICFELFQNNKSIPWWHTHPCVSTPIEISRKLASQTNTSCLATSKSSYHFSAHSSSLRIVLLTGGEYWWSPML